MRRPRGVHRSILLAAALVATGSPAAEGAWSVDGRFKAFGALAVLPGDDLQRTVDGQWASDGDLDLRLMARADRGRWSTAIDYSLIYETGDSWEFNRMPLFTLEQLPTNDDRRFVDLTWTLEEGSDYRLYHRFDRFAVRYEGDDWRVTAGRDPVSWGSGRVFQAVDVFAPFAPTTTDRDYRPGEDGVVFDALFGDGSDLQVVAVLRRDEDKERRFDEGTYAVKWHTLLGASSELELMAGEHFEDTILGATIHVPVGSALLQTDWLATRLDEGEKWVISAIVNLDYSFEVAQHNAYVFLEYYRNGFGRNQTPIDIFDLPQPLVLRLQQGEVFNFMKDYTALGGFFDWHPLVRQDVALLSNWHDGSNLFQTTLTYEPGDHARLQVGVTAPLGHSGEEFGGIDLADGYTHGGATQFYARFSYYF